jgi:hypothetical protein
MAKQDLIKSATTFPPCPLEDVLGLPAESIYDNRLYRALDRLLPHKAAIERHLRERLGELFGLQYDLLLYDVTICCSMT